MEARGCYRDPKKVSELHMGFPLSSLLIKEVVTRLHFNMLQNSRGMKSAEGTSVPFSPVL